MDGTLVSKTQRRLHLRRLGPLHYLLLYRLPLPRGALLLCRVNHHQSQTVGDLSMHLEQLHRHHLQLQPLSPRQHKVTIMTPTITIRRHPGLLLLQFILNHLPFDEVRIYLPRTPTLASRPPTSKTRLGLL